MADYEVVALWVVEDGEAPGILEGDKVRLLRVVVEMDGPEASNLLACHLRPVDALLELRGEYCSASAWRVLTSVAWASHVVHMRKKPRYLLCSNSAMMQSTMCGLGVMMYTASMSLMVSRRSSMRSMSVGSEEAAAGGGAVAYL